VGPLASLWCYEGEVGPLIAPEMAENMAAVMARTQVTHRRTMSLPTYGYRQSETIRYFFTMKMKLS